MERENFLVNSDQYLTIIDSFEENFQPSKQIENRSKTNENVLFEQNFIFETTEKSSSGIHHQLIKELSKMPDI